MGKEQGTTAREIPGIVKDKAIGAARWVRENPTDAAASGFLMLAFADMGYAVSQYPDMGKAVVGGISSLGMLSVGGVMHEYSKILRGKAWSAFQRIGYSFTLAEGIAIGAGQGIMLSGNQDLMLPGLLVSGIATYSSMLHYTGTVDSEKIREKDPNQLILEAFDRMTTDRLAWERRYRRRVR